MSKAKSHALKKKDFFSKGGKRTETVHHMHKRHEAEDKSFQDAFKKRFG